MFQDQYCKWELLGFQEPREAILKGTKRTTKALAYGIEENMGLRKAKNRKQLYCLYMTKKR